MNAPLRLPPLRGKEKTGFTRSRAFIIGINDYLHHRTLVNAVNDAEKVAGVLRDIHGYEVRLFVEPDDTTFEKLNRLLDDLKGGDDPIQAGERVVFYFAGHGKPHDIAEADSNEVENFAPPPGGVLIPRDAPAFDPTGQSYIDMHDLCDRLAKLPCTHLLVILDCCFAGLASQPTRDSLSLAPLYQERYLHYIGSPARSLLTSTNSGELAADGFGVRGGGPDNSPFARALIDGLTKQADISPPPDGNGFITQREIELFLDERLAGQLGGRQTPGLYALDGDGDGQYVFQLPEARIDRLRPAPELTEEANPYQGLKPFTLADRDLLGGRDELIAQGIAHLTQGPPPTLTVVVGPAGSGKTSLVQAGILPRLIDLGWHVLPTLRLPELSDPPTNNTNDPLEQLAQLPLPFPLRSSAIPDLAAGVEAWHTQTGNDAPVLLVVEQLENLYATCTDQQRGQFLSALAALLADPRANARVIVTVRSDYESMFQVKGQPLAEAWPAVQIDPQAPSLSGRLFVRAMQYKELQQAILRPTQEMALFFEPPELLTQLVNDAFGAPGGLAWLSEAMAELYRRCWKRWADRDDRSRMLLQSDYIAMNGLAGLVGQAATRDLASPGAELPAEQARKLVLVRLVDEVRRPAQVLREDLDYGDPYSSNVPPSPSRRLIEQLIRNRLLVASVSDTRSGGRPQIEVAHPAVVQQPFMDALLEEAASDLPLPYQRALNRDARIWAENKYSPGRLWILNTTLTQIRNPTAPWFNAREQSFIARSRRWRRTLFLAGTLAALIILGLILLSWFQAEEAARQTRVQLASSLASNAQVGLATDPQLSLLLAIEALSITHKFGNPPVPVALTAMHQVLRRTPDQYLDLGSTEHFWGSGMRSFIRDVSFSPNGKQVLVTTSRSGVYLFDTEAGQLINHLAGGFLEETKAEFSPDGQYIVVRGLDVSIYSARDGQGRRTLLEQAEQEGPDADVVHFTSDSQSIITTNYYPREDDLTAITFWDVNDLTAKYVMTTSLDLLDIRVIPKHQELLLTSADQYYRWSPGTEPVPLLQGGQAPIPQIHAFSPDTNFVASFEVDHVAIRRFPYGSLVGKSGYLAIQCQRADETTGECLDDTPGGRLIFSQDGGTLLYVAPDDGTFISVYTASDQSWLNASWDWHEQIFRTVDGYDSSSLSSRPALAMVEDVFALSGIDSGIVGLYGIDTPDEGRPYLRYEVPTEIHTAIYNRTGDEILVSRWSGYEQIEGGPSGFSHIGGDIEILDAKSGLPERVFEGRFSSATYSSDFSQIVVCQESGIIQLLDSVTGSSVMTITDAATLSNNRHSECSATLTSDRKHIVSVTSADKITSWNAETGEFQMQLETESEGVPPILSADARRMATFEGGTLTLWDLDPATGEKSVNGSFPQLDDIETAAFSPDGKLLLISHNEVASDGPVRDPDPVLTPELWDVSSGKRIAQLLGHGEKVTFVTFDPSGGRAFTLDRAGELNVWDLATRQLLFSIYGTDLVSANMSADGRYLLTLDRLGPLRQYVTGVNELLELGMMRTGRSLTKMERAQFLGEPLPLLAPPIATSQPASEVIP